MWTKWHLGKPAKLLPHLRLTMQGTKSQAYWRKCWDKSASMAPRMTHPERGPLAVTAAGAWNLDDFCKMWISCLVSWREVPFTSFPEALFFSSLLASDSKKNNAIFWSVDFIDETHAQKIWFWMNWLHFWAKASSVQSLRIRGWPNGRFGQPKATKNIQKGILCWGIQGGHTSFYVLDSIQLNIETWNVMKHSNYKIGTFCLICIDLHLDKLNIYFVDIKKHH